MSESTPQDELESRVVALLDNPETTADEWIRTLAEGQQAGHEAVFKKWVNLAQTALARREDVEGGIDLLKWRAENTPIEFMTGKDWVKAADVVAGSNPHLLVLIQEAGFGQRLAARECVRRLRLLHGMTPGALCLHRTWGFGVIQKSDPLYKKVEIHFNGRPSHAMAMAVAAETMQLLDEQHLLAQWHNQREGIQALVKDNPAEVVRMALRSFGPLPAQALQDKLQKSGIVAPADWKRFWEAARKVLKADPLVSLPAKRTDAIRLLDRAAGFDEMWYDRLANERNIKTILMQVRDLSGHPDILSTMPPVQRRTVANRLAFAMLGATSRQPGYKFTAAMLAAAFSLTPEECAWPAAIHGFLQPDALLALLHDLPARDIAPALDFLFAQDAAAAEHACLHELAAFNFTALQEVMNRLLKQGAEESCRQLYAAACASHRVREEMLLWILKNPDTVAGWNLPGPDALAPMVMAELEQDYMGDRLRTQKLLRERFEDPQWLQEVFGAMPSGRQTDFFKRINQSPAWSGLDRQVLQAKIIKLFPHLQAVISGETEQEPVATYGAVTSHRSYRERQEQLEKLINVDIPANSKEIAVARSYGDLRENFEYKAAKEMQGVLLARRGELEAMLSGVRPSDFSEAPADVAGVGSTVTLAYPDGREERFHILGEWDQLPEKQIISSATRLAKALAGKQAGDTVAIPTEDGGEVECRLTKVEELPQDIREWMK